MLDEFIKYWKEVFATKPLREFLREVMKYFDSETINGEVVTQLHRLTQLDEMRKQGVLSNDNYILRRTEISAAAQNLLKLIEENHLPILPIDAKAGKDSGSFYSITHSDIEEWRYIKRGRIKNRIGIRVNGSSMEPDFLDGDVLICKKTLINEISSTQSVIVVAENNEVYLKKVRKNENKLILISINKDFEDFELPMSDILEFWLVETKIS